MNSTILLTVIEYLVGLACLIYVCILSSGSIKIFDLEQTAQSFDLVTHDNLSQVQVPSITICDSKSYKIYVENVEEFNQALLSEADIGPLELNRQNWKVTSFFNPFFGRCFTYTFIGFQDNLEMYPALTFHQNNSYQVYLHEEGWEILIQFDSDLTEKIISLDIAKESKEGYKIYYLQYSTKTLSKVETTKHKCNETIQVIDFKTCLVEELWTRMDSTWRPYFGPKSNISYLEIKEPKEVVKSYFRIQSLVDQLYTNASNPSSVTCTIPCKLTTFTSTIWKGHQNAFALFDSPSGYDLQNENFSTLMFGSNGKTQIGTEYIYMNINSLLSAIGGNLGMFLGFSVFSIYQIISNKLRSLL